MTPALAAAGALALAGCGGATSAKLSTVRHRSCPAADVGNAPSPLPSTKTVLVPGDPVAVLVCRYWGRSDSGRTGTLAQRPYVASRQRADSLARRLDALRAPRHLTAEIDGCDEVLGGRSVLLFFRYAHEPDDPVRITKSGCIPVSNGHPRALRLALGALKLGEHWPDEGLL